MVEEASSSVWGADNLYGIDSTRKGRILVDLFVNMRLAGSSESLQVVDDEK